jgi:transcriptional regulator with XRE-family HTH domain
VRHYDPEKLVKDIGRRVAEIRRERGLTQEALATKLRATMQWVQQIEYGANLTIYSLAKLADALGAPLEAFLTPPHASSYARSPGRPPRPQPVVVDASVPETAANPVLHAKKPNRRAVAVKTRARKKT